MRIPTLAEHVTLMDSLRTIQTTITQLSPAISAIESYPTGAEANGVLRGLATAALEIKGAIEAEERNTPELRAAVERERLRRRADNLEKEMNRELAAAGRSRGESKIVHEKRAEEHRSAWQTALAALTEQPSSSR